MSELEVSASPVPVAPKTLNQAQRVVAAFSAPSKVFTEIQNGYTSWWMPFVLFLVVGTSLFSVVTAKVGWNTIAETAIHASPKAAEKLDQLSPEQRQTQMKVSAVIQEGIWAVAPLWVLVFNLIGAAIILATMNFGFGGKATFGKMLAVTWYAGLPGLIKLALGLIALLAGLDPGAFLPANPAGTNAAFYLNIAETPKWLYGLAQSMDITSLWTMVLIAIGASIVSGTKRSAGYIAVFGWWILSVIIGVALASVTG